MKKKQVLMLVIILCVASFSTYAQGLGGLGAIGSEIGNAFWEAIQVFYDYAYVPLLFIGLGFAAYMWRTGEPRNRSMAKGTIVVLIIIGMMPVFVDGLAGWMNKVNANVRKPSVTIYGGSGGS